MHSPFLNMEQKSFTTSAFSFRGAQSFFLYRAIPPNQAFMSLELGMSLQDFVDEFGDGDTKAVQVGGASGFLVPRKRFGETSIGYKGKLTGISLPTGGSMMLFNSTRSMFNVLDNYLEFFREESCGQCTPCRVGCQQLLIGIKAVKQGQKTCILPRQTAQADRNHAVHRQMRTGAIGGQFVLVDRGEF
jgi:[NiFe] hydrogenase diaphorase moiety large subunit